MNLSISERIRTMKTTTLITSLLFTAVSSVSQANCNPAKSPELVDGTTASLEQLVDNQKAVKTYMGEANSYLECLDLEEANAIATGSETEETKVVRDAFYNATVDQMNITAANFNTEIQNYKARSAN